jgi:Arc/MetJ-type ribon-helix-helix transcriptional regulator
MRFFEGLLRGHHSASGMEESNRMYGGRWPSGMICHTQDMVQKIAVTLDQRTVADLDRWVSEGRYPNRSRALKSAVNLLSEREKRTRLARELTKLDPQEEKQMPNTVWVTALGPNTERRNLLGGPESSPGPRADRIAAGSNPQSRIVQSEVRNGDCHGHHESATGAQALLCQDFADSDNFR